MHLIKNILIDFSFLSEEGEEPEFNSHESAVVKTMIKGPAATHGKHWGSPVRQR